MTVELFNEDCMVVMARYPDNYFDLAIVDPPYGIGNNLLRNGPSRTKLAQASTYKLFDNSKAPDPEYFIELKRVSLNQIIWGANHFADKFCSASPCWIVWDKKTTGDFADCELAYTSFTGSVKQFTYMWNGMHQGSFGGNTKLNEKRIHPTQKPVKLYEWILKEFAHPDCRILDTHLGSGSSAIAAHYGDYWFIGCELDPDYYQAARERVDQATRQVAMF